MKTVGDIPQLDRLGHVPSGAKAPVFMLGVGGTAKSRALPKTILAAVSDYEAASES